MEREMEGMTEEDRRALRGSKFAPLPSLPSTSRYQPRLAHPGGPLTTNKAAALAKFLERKLQEPNGLASINPDLLELAVKNAKDTVNASSHCGTSNPGRTIRHVTSFGDFEDTFEEGKEENPKPNNYKKKNKKKKMKKDKNLKAVNDFGYAAVKKPKKL